MNNIYDNYNRDPFISLFSRSGHIPPIVDILLGEFDCALVFNFGFLFNFHYFFVGLNFFLFLSLHWSFHLDLFLNSSLLDLNPLLGLLLLPCWLLNLKHKFLFLSLLVLLLLLLFLSFLDLVVDGEDACDDEEPNPEQGRHEDGVVHGAVLKDLHFKIKIPL